MDENASGMVVSPVIDVTDFQDVLFVVPGRALSDDETEALKAAWFARYGVRRPDGVLVLRPPFVVKPGA